MRARPYSSADEDSDTLRSARYSATHTRSGESFSQSDSAYTEDTDVKLKVYANDDPSILERAARKELYRIDSNSLHGSFYVEVKGHSGSTDGEDSCTLSRRSDNDTYTSPSRQSSFRSGRTSRSGSLTAEKRYAYRTLRNGKKATSGRGRRPTREVSRERKYDDDAAYKTRSPPVNENVRGGRKFESQRPRKSQRSRIDRRLQGERARETFDRMSSPNKRTRSRESAGVHNKRDTRREASLERLDANDRGYEPYNEKHDIAKANSRKTGPATDGDKNIVRAGNGRASHNDADHGPKKTYPKGKAAHRDDKDIAEKAQSGRRQKKKKPSKAKASRKGNSNKASSKMSGVSSNSDLDMATNPKIWIAGKSNGHNGQHAAKQTTGHKKSGKKEAKKGKASKEKKSSKHPTRKNREKDHNKRNGGAGSSSTSNNVQGDSQRKQVETNDLSDHQKSVDRTATNSVEPQSIRERSIEGSSSTLRKSITTDQRDDYEMDQIRKDSLNESIGGSSRSKDLSKGGSLPHRGTRNSVKETDESDNGKKLESAVNESSIDAPEIEPSVSRDISQAHSSSGYSKGSSSRKKRLARKGSGNISMKSSTGARDTTPPGDDAMKLNTEDIEGEPKEHSLLDSFWAWLGSKSGSEGNNDSSNNNKLSTKNPRNNSLNSDRKSNDAGTGQESNLLLDALSYLQNISNLPTPPPPSDADQGKLSKEDPRSTHVQQKVSILQGCCGCEYVTEVDHEDDRVLRRRPSLDSRTSGQRSTRSHRSARSQRSARSRRSARSHNSARSGRRSVKSAQSTARSSNSSKRRKSTRPKGATDSFSTWSSKIKFLRRNNRTVYNEEVPIPTVITTGKSNG